MKQILAVLSVCGLVACGGGGGTSGSAGSTSTNLTLAGVAATGAAISSGAVAVKCKNGIGNATTSGTGGFTVTVAGGTFPCIVKVTAVNGVALHSVADGSGSSVMVNVSPLTDLIVAAASGASSASTYDTFDTSAQAKVTGLAMASAKNSVAIALTSVLSLANVDPIKDTLVAGSGTGLDGQLDQLAAAMKRTALTIADLGAIVVKNGGPVSNSILAATFGLPYKPMSVNTLVDSLGQIFPLRVNVAIAAAGVFNGAFYDFHKLDGTTTPCTYSSANAATCHGTNGVFSVASQSSPLLQSGAMSATTLIAGPDLFGFTFRGVVIGTTWSGTFVKVPTKDDPRTDWGTFSVDAVFQGGSITVGN